MAYVAESDARLASIDNDSTVRTDAVEAGAAQIDAALLAGGWIAPADLAGIADADAKTRLTALFKVTNRALAARILTAGGTATGAKTGNDYDDAVAWLERVRNGEEDLRPLATASTVAFAIASGRGLGEDAHLNELTETVFDGVEQVPY